MHSDRKTAVVQFELFSGATEGSLPLASERDFGVILMVEGVSYPAQNFRSPINDEQWRDFIRRLRDCNVNHDASGYRGAASIRSLAQQMYQSLVALNPVLREFLGRTGVPRRLVIQTTRPELHLLPWAALIDEGGTFLAANDLSVVQSWGGFNSMPATTTNTLQLMTVLGQDTNLMTADSLSGQPPEIRIVDGMAAMQAGTAVTGVDILHLEEHGSAVSGEIGETLATALGTTFGGVKLALLWSCYSGAANSWGESPALCLHKSGAVLVLSFLAELHNLDARSISAAFYNDVFGPAASRDPESALVRIRAAKFTGEFPFANWASMTVYMRSPLDLSALPLNGPRVPAAGWVSDTASYAADDGTVSDTAAADEAAADSAGDDAPDEGTVEADLENDVAAVAAGTGDAAALVDVWADLANTVSQLQPGTINEFHGFEVVGAPVIAALPRSVFRPWRGNVIRIDGAHRPLGDDTVAELNLDRTTCPVSEAAEKLVWFIERIRRYGSPLIVWTNAAPHHVEFLKTIEPGSTLTILLIYGPRPEPTILELVDMNQLEEAQKVAMALPEDCGDEQLSAAYFAFARLENPEGPAVFLRRISNPAEQMLLIGNFVSRRGVIPNPKPDWMLHHPDGKLSNLQQQHCQEDCYRKVMSDPGTEAPMRESARAKHELGYMLRSVGKTSVAEMMYGQALADFDACPPEQHDSRWHTGLGNLLRDWADLLSSHPHRLDKAAELLRRAMAIHSFHGRRMQMAYAMDTAARIALTGQKYREAIDYAVETANLFEEFKNWRGWGEAIKVLFDCLAETRETARMLSMADLAIEKLHGSNLPQAQRDRLRMAFLFEKAKACWIAGKFAEARTELEKLGCGAGAADCKVELDPAFEGEVRRLWKFLSLHPAAH
jgi:tetratricopeptide (TPR) repeat protein